MKYNLDKKGKIIAVVILLIIMALGVFLYQKFTSDDTDSSMVKWEQEKNDDPEHIKIPGYSVLRIPSNTKDVEITLGNPEGNQCYFEFEIIVEGESLYKSELVKAGYAIKAQTLSKSLKKGTYDAVIKITPYSLDKSSKYIGANVNTTIEAI